MFLGVTLYLHRDQSHGGSDPASGVCGTCSVSGCGSAPARSRKSGSRCIAATTPTPTSLAIPTVPVIFGLRRVVFEGFELYRAADPRPATAAQLRAWHARRLAGAAASTATSHISASCCSSLAHLVLFGVPAIIMIAVHLAAQPFFAGGVINGLGHAVGYRSFEMPSTATNLVPWALLLGGEELHNNHHAFPRSARFAVQRWELDVGWLWIRLFRALGLARVRWVAPRPQFARRAASSMPIR